MDFPFQFYIEPTSRMFIVSAIAELASAEALTFGLVAIKDAPSAAAKTAVNNFSTLRFI